MMTLSPRRFACLLLLVVVWTPEVLANTAAAPWRLCAEAVTRAGQKQGLPDGLLGAIAKVESGRRRASDGELLAWPWTVTAQGRGRFLPSKAAAIAEVQALRARGMHSIDVGCMQINLRYHPDAFDNLDDAFDPARNAAAAARLLAALRTARGSWTGAVGIYHSARPTLNGPYRVKVFRTLFQDRRRAKQATRSPRRPD